MAEVDRTAIRRTRRQLARSVRRDAAARVGGAWRADAGCRAARRIGAYVPVAGEVDPWCILECAWRDGAEVFLPVVIGEATDEARTLRFAPYRPGTPLTPKAFGIPEPAPDTATVDPGSLDLVLVPLVAFDHCGTRVGMGAGYYDRTFGARLAPGAPDGPRLVGLAYAWQEVEHLRAEPWDVPLDAVLTERGLHRAVAQPK